MSGRKKKRLLSALSGQRPKKSVSFYRDFALKFLAVLGFCLVFSGLYLGQKRLVSWWSRIDLYPQSNGPWTIDVVSNGSQLSSAEKAAVTAVLNKELLSNQKPNLARLAKRTQAEISARQLSLTLVQPQKLLVTLKLYKPVAVVESKKKYLLSDDGFVYDGHKESSDPSLPVVTGIIPPTQDFNLTEGGTAVLDTLGTKRIAESLEILKLGQENGFVFQNLRFDEVRGFWGTIAPQGLSIFLGRGEYLLKFGRLKEVIDHLGNELNLTERIELDYSDKAVVKKKTM